MGCGLLAYQWKIRTIQFDFTTITSVGKDISVHSRSISASMSDIRWTHQYWKPPSVVLLGQSSFLGDESRNVETSGSKGEIVHQQKPIFTILSNPRLVDQKLSNSVKRSLRFIVYGGSEDKTNPNHWRSEHTNGCIVWSKFLPPSKNKWY